MKKNIVIVGYPKSGTTWIARLVAELVECPLEGAWGFESVTTAYEEGRKRTSDFICYKSHHTFNEIYSVKKGIYKIIYVVRDPRDIVISSLYYFNISNPTLKKIVPFASSYKLFDKIVNMFLSLKSKKI
ncbi:MAG TPA: sulfotransferase domain-containing protein, partial [Flavobacteriaceae bacterium]|nr:sulfotransferase domain-containing protein [Flavobacteriaceae bacterium]